ncbi:MAG: Aldehyde dehydrogenase [Nitrospira sp.]|nr:Aldehyde dehydrogenase [Nitrospira sp.]
MTRAQGRTPDRSRKANNEKGITSRSSASGRDHRDRGDKVKAEAEALQVANDTDAGLTGAVITR